jgi:hypothetical protein
MDTIINTGWTETQQQREDRYFRRCANIAYNRMIEAIGKEKADKTIGSDILRMSWKEIRVALETLADLAEKQAYEAQAADQADEHLYELGMGR